MNLNDHLPEILVIVFNSFILLILILPYFGRVFKNFRKVRYQKLGTSSKIYLLHQLNDAIKRLSKTKTGALITLQMHDELDNLRTDGIILDSKISSPLLVALFQKESPLHDGALVIVGDRIKYVGTFYHITEQSVDNAYGARHRAALGISEQCDSVSIVVSEETGHVSLVREGKIVTINDDMNFQDTLSSYLK